MAKPSSAKLRGNNLPTASTILSKLITLTGYMAGAVSAISDAQRGHGRGSLAGSPTVRHAALAHTVWPSSPYVQMTKPNRTVEPVISGDPSLGPDPVAFENSVRSPSSNTTISDPGSIALPIIVVRPFMAAHCYFYCLCSHMMVGNFTPPPSPTGLTPNRRWRDRSPSLLAISKGLTP
jgi:hypothetical protein